MPATIPRLGDHRRDRCLVLLALVLLLVVFLGLLYGLARTVRPWYDEAMFANPALNLAERGFMGTTVLAAGWLQANLHRYTYWIFPLDLVTLAGWYKLVGFSLLSTRVLSMLWTLVFLAEIYYLLRRWSQNTGVALLSVVLVAFDYNILRAGSFGRYEPMVAALGFGGYCCYLALRERSLPLALLASNACIAASGMTHPNGLLYFCGLAFLVLYHDRTALRWRHLAVAAAPYLVGALCWGAYALQSPQDFYLQLRLHSRGRIALFNPLMALRGELERYVLAAGLGRHSAGHTGPIALKAVGLAAYAAGVAALLALRALRTHPGYRVLLGLTAVHFLYQCFVDGIKFPFYLVHMMPLYAVILAVVLHHIWTGRRVLRPLVAATVLGLMGLGAGGALLRICLNTYQNAYWPAVEYLRRHAASSDLVMATSGFGFGYGFQPNLMDDIRLGYYSGKVPKFIVVDETYQYNFENWEQTEPQVYQFIRHRLDREYDLVYDHNFYRIYRRKPEAGPASAPGGAGKT